MKLPPRGQDVNDDKNLRSLPEANVVEKMMPETSPLSWWKLHTCLGAPRVSELLNLNPAADTAALTTGI